LSTNPFCGFNPDSGYIEKLKNKKNKNNGTDNYGCIADKIFNLGNTQSRKLFSKILQPVKTKDNR
jgi:hypothetical protein